MYSREKWIKGEGQGGAGEKGGHWDWGEHPHSSASNSRPWGILSGAFGQRG